MMKKLQQIFKCAGNILKKKFFNKANNDIYQECKEAPVINQLVGSEKNETEEYLSSYNSATRWQTV